MVNSLLSFFWFSDGQLAGTVELIFTCLTPKQHQDHPAFLSSFIFKPGPLDKSADLTQCFVIWTIRFHCVGKNAEAITLLEASLVRLNWGRSSELFLLRESYARQSIRLIPDKYAVRVWDPVFLYSYDQNTISYTAHTEAGKEVWMYIHVFCHPTDTSIYDLLLFHID